MEENLLEQAIEENWKVAKSKQQRTNVDGVVFGRKFEWKGSGCSVLGYLT